MSAHLLAAEKAPIGRRYVIGAPATPMAELLALIAEVTGRSPPKRRVPFPVALATARLAELRARRTGVPPLASVEGVRLARYPRPLDSARARTELGWHPRPVEEALRAAITAIWQRGAPRRSRAA